VGDGDLDLGSAVNRMFTPGAAGAQTGDTFWGLIEHQDPGLAEFELTLCTYNGAGAGSIARAATPVASSTGLRVNFSAGTKIISNVILGSKAYVEAVQQLSIASGVVNIDLRTGGIFKLNMTANITAINILNATSGFGNYFTFEFTGDGTARTVVWPWTWLTGTPILSSVAGKRDRGQAWTDDGVTWFAAMMHQYY
jgi:hypothetical protein